ncbi:alpha/beta hydrolase [Sphingomonas montanisoli]|uniref:Alpha/beta hydrolase n=2 Tax=Sphingomonas montanisoli TaxID=2606412 RepID=A0A5D9CCG3_9SPHN|nr:alpha/beta hydrolase [Sphingomonas montanisoli]
MESDFMRPDVRTFLDKINGMDRPALYRMAAADARAQSAQDNARSDLPAEPIAFRRDLTIPAPHGSIAARFYDPQPERDEAGPLIVFIHGGGFVLGDLDTYDSAATAIANGTGLPVISIAYRLAPDHPWPAAPDDCEAALRWIAEQPDLFGRAHDRIALAGDSAGATLSIVSAMALRETPAALPVTAIWALYPATDLRRRYPSTERFAEGHMLTAELLRWFNECYAPDFRHWRASPGHGILAGLPPVLVSTSSLDPLLDQGRAFAKALVEEGGSVIYDEAAGTIHGWLTLRRALPSANADLARNLALFRTLIDLR